MCFASILLLSLEFSCFFFSLFFWCWVDKLTVGGFFGVACECRASRQVPRNSAAFTLDVVVVVVVVGVVGAGCTNLPQTRTRIYPTIECRQFCTHSHIHNRAHTHTHTRNHTKMQGFWARPPSTSRFAGHTHKHRHTHTFLLPRKSRPLTPDRSGDRRQAALHTCVFFRRRRARQRPRKALPRERRGAGGKTFCLFRAQLLPQMCKIMARRTPHAHHRPRTTRHPAGAPGGKKGFGNLHAHAA